MSIPFRAQLCLASMLALLLAPHPAQAAANTITVTKTQNVAFGSFVVLPSCSGCTITVANDGSRTASAGIVLTSKLSGQPGLFNITCNNPSCAFTVSPVSNVNWTMGGVVTTITAFTPVPTSTTTPSTVSVGAKLTIPNSGSTPNAYTKNFTIVTSP